MRVIIAGSRTATMQDIYDAIVRNDLLTKIQVVITGGEPGPDRYAENWAQNVWTPVERYPADRAKHGRSSIQIRNRLMARNADALLAVWDGKSRHIKNMINESKAHGLTVYTYEINGGGK